MLFIYITRLTSKEIFSPSNKIHRKVGGAKDLSASLFIVAGSAYSPLRQRKILDALLVNLCPEYRLQMLRKGIISPQLIAT